MDIEVCGACGSGSNSHLIVKCVRCGDYEHCYCLKEVAWETPREWYCAKCQEYTNSNRGPKPSQGGQTVLQRETLSHSNVVHQISPKSPNRFGNDEDTGCKSEMESLNQNKDVILAMGSTVEYSRRPAPVNCWRGCFHVFYAGEKLNLGEFKAYFPSKVSPRVNDIVKMMPTDLQLELLPRMNDWPKSFETITPVHEDIGVFFFSNKPDACEKIHSNLLEASSNYVLRAYIHDIKLLIYSSEVLPPDSQWIDGENYLWGLFVRSKGKSYPWRSGSATT